MIKKNDRMNKLLNKKTKLLQKVKETNERTIVYLADELVKKRLSVPTQEQVSRGSSIINGDFLRNCLLSFQYEEVLRY